MPEPLPKADRLRRNRPSSWTDLPVEGPGAPAFSVRSHGLDEAGERRWERLWLSPEANMWHGYDAWIVMRLCQVDQLWRETGKGTLLTEPRHLETSLGLGSKGRREMRWQVVDGDAEVVEGSRGPGWMSCAAGSGSSTARPAGSGRGYLHPFSGVFIG